jgi:predicted ATPase
LDLLALALGLSKERRTSFEESAQWSFAAPVVSESPNPTFGGDLAEPATPLVGRERLVSEAAGLLRGSGMRLLTLTGTGGVGKTRVGLRVAEELRREYADDAVLVGLEALTDPTQVLPAIAHALGLMDTGDRPLFDRLQGYLSEKELLLLLDNFEQVRTATPSIVRLLSRCPRLKMLVTSRMPLRVRAEQQLDVPPLETPTPMPVPNLETIENSPATALFADRARTVDPSFRLTDANAPAVAEICRRLDGLPLAIELAASRTKLLAPMALLSRLTPTLRLLAGGGPDLPERQRTMRRTIEWSHDLLNEDEQALFRRLAVFLGGCTLEAAEAVCSFALAPSDQPGERRDMVEGLSSLVDASLLQRENGPEAELRLKMLAVVREYARERLAESGESTVARKRHAEYFVAQAEAAEPRLLGPDQAAWLERLEREHDNLREALRWAREVGDIEAGLRLTGALCWFWWTRGYHCEGRQ